MSKCSFETISNEQICLNGQWYIAVTAEEAHQRRKNHQPEKIATKEDIDKAVAALCELNETRMCWDYSDGAEVILKALGYQIEE